jgi:aspartate carbamoyltransferase catalytic subunit
LISGAIQCYNGNSIHFVSPEGLSVPSDVKQYLSEKAIEYTETEDLDSVVPKVDVLYQTRIQQERFSDEEEYLKYKGHYIIDRPMADRMKEGAIIMHPLPRVDEISTDVDSSPHARYFNQVGYGLLTRMALLKILLKPE